MSKQTVRLLINLWALSLIGSCLLLGIALTPQTSAPAEKDQSRLALD